MPRACAGPARRRQSSGRGRWDSWLVFLIAAVFESFAAGAAFPFFEPIQPPRSFQIMVHRGEARQTPENSRSALQRCIEDGLEWAEVDVRLTRDGRHVLSHNDSITNAAGEVWAISERDWLELKEVDIGSRFAARFANERLLLLQDAFELCRGRLNLYLDCKHVNPEQLARDIQAAGMERQVVVYSDLEKLRQLRKGSSDRIATMTKWRPAQGGPAWAVSNGLAAIEIDAPELTPDLARGFKRAGIKVQAKVLGAWDQPEFWDRAIASGADWLQTDLPEELYAHALWQRLPRRPVQISLHRGANRYAPENTLPAFVKAVRMGADYVEFDVRATKDGEFFLLHDSKLDRTTDGSGPINQISTEAVRRLSAGVKFGRPYADIRLPTLDEFMSSFAGKIGFYFDAKAIPPAALAESLTRFDMVERTVVYQSPQYLTQLKALNPKIRALPPLGKPQDLNALVATLQPYGVDASWDILSPELIAKCHAAGVKVFSDALDEHEKIEDYLPAIRWGIDVIQTDHPLRVFRAVELYLAQPPAELRQRRKPGVDSD